MKDTLLVVNAGSSSLKFEVYQLVQNNALMLDCRGHLSGIGSPQPVLRINFANSEPLLERTLLANQCATPADAQRITAGWLVDYLDKPPRAIGHRIVHGGSEFADSVVIDSSVMRHLESLAPLAPLHQPSNLAPVRDCQRRWPDAVQVACFDSAFHRTQSAVAERYALPQTLYDQGVRRYGFHGLSYEYIAGHLRREQPAIADGRVIVAHLGAGASCCGLVDGRSVGTTMGFSALDGLPMATRPGSLDPGVLLWMQQQGMTSDAIQHLLYTESGLKGLSGISGDMRELLASQEPSARLAVDYFFQRTAEAIAALGVATSGLDALIFTAGIGENSAASRRGICARLGWLGVALDASRNAANSRCISPETSAIGVYVIPTNEERQIAAKTLAFVEA